MKFKLQKLNETFLKNRNLLSENKNTQLSIYQKEKKLRDLHFFNSVMPIMSIITVCFVGFTFVAFIVNHKYSKEEKKSKLRKFWFHLLDLEEVPKKE
jgi:heme/copper-type cytochrome/quinol oxidase subunit 2